MQTDQCAPGVSVCAPIAVIGVAASDWRISVVSGADQSVLTSDSLSSVTLRIIDLYGDPVAGVSVQIEQTVSTWQAACTQVGRCAVPSILAALQSSAVSDADGIISVQPAQVDGVPTITHLAAIAGTAGFAEMSLEKHP